MNSFINELEQLRKDYAVLDDPRGVIPEDKDVYSSQSVKNAFGSFYKRLGVFIWNNLITNYNIDPVELCKEYNISSADEFCKTFYPILKNDGFNFV